MGIFLESRQKIAAFSAIASSVTDEEGTAVSPLEHVFILAFVPGKKQRFRHPDHTRQKPSLNLTNSSISMIR
ncbi:hypothetical protein [Paraburkholderia sp. SIMBA_030]|uniref:hypothetical protein n=1 Tax=Paraburkholderia sp. SIMBA_030 TaxID=3085773 RepID=UPI00397BA5A2